MSRECVFFLLYFFIRSLGIIHLWLVIGRIYQKVGLIIQRSSISKKKNGCINDPSKKFLTILDQILSVQKLSSVSRLSKTVECFLLGKNKIVWCQFSICEEFAYY